MSKESRETQADRTRNIADRLVDQVLQETLRDAAQEYRLKAGASGYALFKDHSQLTGAYRSENDLMRAVSPDLIPGFSVTNKDGSMALPEGYRIEYVAQINDPQPD